MATSDKSGINELARIVETHLNPLAKSSSSSSTTSGAAVSSLTNTRYHTPPFMGTSAKMVKRRNDNDSLPTRVESTDIINQQVQPHYQNVRSILSEEKQTSSLPVEELEDSQKSTTDTRQYFEQQFKGSGSMYDIPPRHGPTHQIITTITTTTTQIPAETQARISSSSNESPTVDRVLEQAVELQKLSNVNTNQPISDEPVVIERTEQYQVYLDSSNHEIHRTPSVSRTALVSTRRTGHATDLDQIQNDRFNDDHRAIQDLTRVLQEHNQPTTMDYSSFSSDSNVPLSSLRTIADRPISPIQSDFTVIDALLSNPVATNDEKSNHTLQWRYQDILSNVRNPHWLDLLKQSPPAVKSSKEKKAKNTSEKSKSKKKQNDTASSTPATTNPEQLSSSPGEQVTGESSDQTPLIDPKDKKKSKKETKEKTKTKAKSKEKDKKDKTAPVDYQAVDAIISSPTSTYLPDSYLDKYKQAPPLTQSSPIESLPVVTVDQSTEKNTKTKDKTKDKTKEKPAKSKKTKDEKKVEEKPETLFHLVNIINELLLHNAAALTVSSGTASPEKENTNAKDPEPLTPGTSTMINEMIHQQPLLQQRQELVNTQAELRTSTDSNQMRTLYRYVDDQGHVLAVSSTPPSQLREQTSIQYPYRTTETSLLHGRQMAVDDERRHILPQYEQRATWQGEPKLPTTVTREDFESQDKRVPRVTEQITGMTMRTIPVSYESDSMTRASIQAEPTRSYRQENQQNLKLAWMPLSYPNEQVHTPSGATGYETDSTISERSASANYRTHDYGPSEGYYRQPTNRTVYHADYRRQHRSPGSSYYPPPPPLPYQARGISPEYGTPSGAMSRNYLEIFRGGDFQDTKPSEVYSLPMTDYVRRTALPTSSARPSRYDQYQSERYSSMANQRSTPSLQPGFYYSDGRYNSNIPPTAAPPVYTTTYYARRSPPEHRYVQSSPNREYNTYIRQSKSFDYRPLRTKLQREYKITPNLLVDEWDFPSVSERNHFSTATSTANRSGVSSPDDVFINKTSQRSLENVNVDRLNQQLTDVSSVNQQKFYASGDEDRKTSSNVVTEQGAVALYNFQGQTNRELSFKKGDQISIKRRINEDWFEGEHRNVVGIFPSNYVEIVRETSEKPIEKEIRFEAATNPKLKSALKSSKSTPMKRCQVVYDYFPRNPDELEIHVGDLITIVEMCDDGWFCGFLEKSKSKNHLEFGTFPGNYVKLLTETY